MHLLFCSVFGIMIQIDKLSVSSGPRLQFLPTLYRDPLEFSWKPLEWDISMDPGRPTVTDDNLSSVPILSFSFDKLETL